MSNVNLSIAVDENHIEWILEVVQNLHSAGMNVEQVLDKLGIITGSIDSAKMEVLSRVEGVSHVELSREYKLAPPESDVQ
ncbi:MULTISPECIES: ketohydroxyglutarate aldolase [Nostoc]|uniref:Ketohydroxyglutarate aldolase n=2 Tax=Nostoc TaxID=1177 RepID=A0ABR8IM64_9NOSO|nr:MULTISPECIES: ketohydroxyglutarate aldolase [Nostoc]MBD2564846.1 ketohydroxyglutarate aldolase [Nostoc linckia FACHB-391]MBD2651385.1 ketohydroxyglutarate aldolase [Nostoc foliaceum FACHB-393]